MLSTEELHQLATSHYGRHWQAPLTRDICALTGAPYKNVFVTVNRWANMHMKISVFAEAAIRLLCQNTLRPYDPNDGFWETGA